MKANENLTGLDELLTEFYGERGTDKREEHERKVASAVYAYRIGEAIKQAREEKCLTQEQLGERIGVKKSQISRLERGYSITIPTMSKVFRALGADTASINFGGGIGSIALW